MICCPLPGNRWCADAMTHREFRKICPGSDTAVLFIHGINGTPNHFRDFVDLVPPDCSVVNMLLGGHGGSVRDFARASMEEWKAQVDAAVEELLEHHSRLLIVGHSMGTLFAIRQAIKHPDRVDGLFLLAVPLKIAIKPRMLRNSMCVYFGNVKEDDLWVQAAVSCYGTEPDWRFWRYIPWTNRYLELFKEIKDVKDQLSALKTPCYCYQSEKDELVSMKACGILRENKHVSVRVLENSGHYYYEEMDQRQLLEDFQGFIKNMA